MADYIVHHGGLVRKMRFPAAALAASVISLAAASDTVPLDAAQLQAALARFAPVEIAADLSALPPGERQALKKLVEAATIMDALYLRQVWAGNEPLLLDLLRDDTPAGRARLRYFLINKGHGPDSTATPSSSREPRQNPGGPPSIPRAPLRHSLKTG